MSPSKKFYSYLSILLIFFLFLFFISFSLFQPDGVEFHLQSQTIIDLCHSDDFITGHISIHDQCEEDDLPKVPFNLTIAFLSDQSTATSSHKVLERIKEEGVEAIIHQGDFGYSSSPEEWEKEINSIFGEDFPIFAAMGNHDYYHWKDYYLILQKRIERLSKKGKDIFQCKGCLGVRSVCNYKGLWLYQTSDGVFNLRDNELFVSQNNPSHKPQSKRNNNNDNIINDNIKEMNKKLNKKRDNDKEEEEGNYYEIDILKQELECAKQKKMTWKICSWHTYSYSDEAFGGKNVEDNYNACIDAGALIVNSHPHAFRKFYPLTTVFSYKNDFATNITKIVNGNQLIITASSATPLIQPGMTMQIVTGLEGDDKNYSYSSSAVDYGALICVFNPPAMLMRNEAAGILQELIVNTKDNVQINFASCRFTAIDGRILDHFTVYLEN